MFLFVDFIFAAFHATKALGLSSFFLLFAWVEQVLLVLCLLHSRISLCRTVASRNEVRNGGIALERGKKQVRAAKSYMSGVMAPLLESLMELVKLKDCKLT